MAFGVGECEDCNSSGWMERVFSACVLVYLGYIIFLFVKQVHLVWQGGISLMHLKRE